MVLALCEKIGLKRSNSTNSIESGREIESRWSGRDSSCECEIWLTNPHAVAVSADRDV